ncbi:MAG: hypothetical protein Q9159_000253 [Coniocarpon cinnabarinum]
MPGLINQEPHHHKPTTKSSQKQYKSRFSSKNDLRDRSRGRVDRSERGIRRTPHQHVMSKFDRKNHAKQMRLQKTKQHENLTDIFRGKYRAPRIVAVVPLSKDVSAEASVRSLNDSLDIEHELFQKGLCTTHVDRFKSSLQYLVLGDNTVAATDACKIADFVLFVLSANEEVDETREFVLRTVESQGISNVFFAIRGLDTITSQKHRQQTHTSLKSYVQHFFSDIERLHVIDSRQECLNIVRSLCTTTPRGINWRDARSWMNAEEVSWHGDANIVSTETGEVTLTGVVRGQNLKADRLVHVGDWGDFQVSTISAAPRISKALGKANAMAVDGTEQGDEMNQPSADQDQLDDLAPEEVVMKNADATPSLISTESKGVLLDDQHYYSERESEDGEERPKRIPKGTSRYQSAWYLGEDSDSGSDLEDFDEWEALTNDSPDPSLETFDALPGSSTMPHGDADFEGPQSETNEDLDMVDVVNEEELAEYRTKRRKDAAQEDQQFPDEIELHPQVLARERLAKYRGLKSPKTSEWNTGADRPHQPSDWDRLLDVHDYRGTKSKVIREALVGGVKPGARVTIRIKDVPMSLKQTHDPAMPLPLFSLLRHEHKRTCVNVSITLKSDAPRSIKSKEELVIQVGARRFLVNPLFSQAGSTPNDVHKFERYLHPGRTAVASFIAPITWGSVPVLVFQRNPATSLRGDDTTMETEQDASPNLQLVGTGTTLPPSTARIIAKRALLTGQPYKIHKRLVTIRYMFFNAEDVAWFKALPLWTNKGRQGTIKESLATHGYYKAVFDGHIGPMDAVGMTLWKRVWPRHAREVGPRELAL